MEERPQDTLAGPRINRPSRRRHADLAVIGLLIVYAASIITAFWRSPYLLTILILPAPAVLILRMENRRQALVMAITGSVLGPSTEILCVMGGLWSYAETGGLPHVPPWIYPLWGCFPTALWIIAENLLDIGRLDRGSLATFQEVSGPGTLVRVCAGIGLEILLFVKLGADTPMAIAAALPLAAVILLADRRPTTPLFMAAGGFMGPLCEALPIASGAWSYANPEILGMPAWMPISYGLFAYLTTRGALAVSWTVNGDG